MKFDDGERRLEQSLFSVIFAESHICEMIDSKSRGYPHLSNIIFANLALNPRMSYHGASYV